MVKQVASMGHGSESSLNHGHLSLPDCGAGAETSWKEAERDETQG